MANRPQEDQEWDSIANILNKIYDEAERLDCGAIADICSDAMDDAENGMSPEDKLFGLCQFFFRFYYRIKRWKTSNEEFNIVYNDSRLEDHKYVDMYRVVNYDWKMYKWARKRGFTNELNNDWFLVPVDSLSEKEKEHFEKKVKK